MLENAKSKYCIISGLAGFNDFLSTLLRGCQLVEYGRSKNIDIKLITTWMGFGNIFWSFFDFTNIIDAELNNSQYVLQNLTSYKPHPQKYTFKDTHIEVNKTNNPLDIRWDHLNDWDYIVEFFSGQWDYHSLFFKYLRLNNEFKKELKHILDFLDESNYVCVNFRMQEMIKVIYGKEAETQYSLKLEEYSNQIIQLADKHNTKKIVICTDSIDLVNRFKDHENIFSFGYAKKLIDSGIDTKSIDRFRGIHMDYYKKINLTSYDICKHTFIDYFLMIMSETLYPAEFGHFGKSALKFQNHIKSNKNIKSLIY